MKAGLKGLRLHDMRHQCLTEMAEAGVPSDVMMKLAGHVSEKMRQHYVHVRDQATKKAVALLPGTGLDTGLGSMDTTLDTLDTKTVSKPS